MKSEAHEAIRRTFSVGWKSTFEVVLRERSLRLKTPDSPEVNVTDRERLRTCGSSAPKNQARLRQMGPPKVKPNSLVTISSSGS